MKQIKKTKDSTIKLLLSEIHDLHKQLDELKEIVKIIDLKLDINEDLQKVKNNAK